MKECSIINVVHLKVIVFFGKVLASLQCSVHVRKQFHPFGISTDSTYLLGQSHTLWQIQDSVKGWGNYPKKKSWICMVPVLLHMGIPHLQCPNSQTSKLTDHQLSSYPGWKYGVSASKERAADIILRQISETSPGGKHGFRNFWWRNLENKFSKKHIHYTPIHPISCEYRCLEPITSRTSGDV